MYILITRDVAVLRGPEASLLVVNSLDELSADVTSWTSDNGKLLEGCNYKKQALGLITFKCDGENNS